MSKRRRRKSGEWRRGQLGRWDTRVLHPRTGTDNARKSTWTIADNSLRGNQCSPEEEFKGDAWTAPSLRFSQERLNALHAAKQLHIGNRNRHWREWIVEYHCIVLQTLRYSKTLLYWREQNYYLVVEDYLAKTIMKTNRYSTKELALLAFRLKNFSVDEKEKL